VLVGQLVQPAVIGVEPRPQHAQRQDLPLLHAGAPRVRIGLAVAPHRDDLFEDGEHPRPQVRDGVNVLQSAQQLRNVIAGLRVEHDGGDVLLAELQLRVDQLAHEISNDEVYWILFGSGATGRKVLLHRPHGSRQISGLHVALKPYRSSAADNFDLGV